MKKVLLVTGFFLSMGLMASAQEKKAAVKATPGAPAQKAAPAPLRKKKKLTAAEQARIQQKIAIENNQAKPAPAPAKSKETIDTPAN